jgi:hypothetical protein
VLSVLIVTPPEQTGAVRLTYSGDPCGFPMLVDALRRQGLDPYPVPPDEADGGEGQGVVWLPGSPTGDPAEQAIWATAQEVATTVRSRVPNVRIEVEEGDGE